MNELKPLPLGNSSFPRIRVTDQIYVDKTRLIFDLASKAEKFFLARPRRFGKSLLISTFESLFKYGLRDFQGLEIEKLWKEKNTFNVVRIDFLEIKNYLSADDFSSKLDSLLVRRFQEFGFVYAPNPLSSPIDQISDWLRRQPVNSFVILIDEYDSPLTACLNDKKLFEKVRSRLAEFYSALKSNDEQIRFLFITGITKFSKTSIFSELNNLSDISLDHKYSNLLGYTSEEIRSYFGGYLRRAADTVQISPQELFLELIKHYDGFCFDRLVSEHVFAPWSVLKFLSSPENGFIDYWFESGGKPTALTQYFKSHAMADPAQFDKEKLVPFSELTGSSDAETLSDVALLTQAGYLTLKKIVGSTAYVGYPNVEVKKAMALLYTGQLLSSKTVEQVGADNIAYRLSTENPESIVHLLNCLFRSIDYQRYPVKDEYSLRAFVQVFFAGAGLEARAEVHNHLGRSDLEVKAGSRYWVMEFKCAERAENVSRKLEEAVSQLNEKNYGLQRRDAEIIRLALVFSLEKREFVKWKSLEDFEKTAD
ncbi:AAA family ATPase [uncultured Turicimonas sp.]|uniref:AAA family ATPase n=1 Tax=uncultured Turicimonas sp. TaxID=1918607 RepID=UPI0028058ECA|nr:AAA family ATPase [uncultured Turicimonas sp.]